MNIKRKIISIFTAAFISTISLSSVAFPPGYGGFQPIADNYVEEDTAEGADFFMDDGASLLCYKSVVEFGNPLPQICSDMGWTVADLHDVDPFKVFGYTIRLIPRYEKAHYNVCTTTPDVCVDMIAQ